jgi:hypothetical protein
MKLNLKRSLSILLIMVVASFVNFSAAQTDTTLVVKADTTMQETTKKEQKRKDEFIVYTGVSFSQLNLSSDTYESGSELGYQLGFAYRRGQFFYWQAGALFNNAVYGFQNSGNSEEETNSLTVKSFDVPLNVGINFLSFANRVVGLRAFVGAVPSFVFGVGDNDYDIQKEDINSFNVYGQAGVGANVAFFIVDLGYNFGFQDLLTDQDSKPGQLFVNLGLRF